MKIFSKVRKREEKLKKMKTIAEEEVKGLETEQKKYMQKMEKKQLKATAKQEKKQKKAIVKAGIVEKDKGYQSYHTSAWWNDHLQHGDKIVLSYRDGLDDAHEKQPLLFDEVRTVDIEGVESLDYICFQIADENLGNRSLTIPVLPVNVIKIFSIRGEEYYKGKKFKVDSPSYSGSTAMEPENPVKDDSGTTEQEPASEKKDPEFQKKEPVKSPVKPSSKDPGFEIVEKDGRFFCPCGNDFGKKAHAVFHHKNHLKKKEGN